MTPEQFERTIDFILQSQARLAVAQEEDREWAKGLFAQMAGDRVRMLHLIEHHSQQIEQFDRFMQETRVWQQEALSKLDRLLDKVSDRKN
jgi:hypothetical protein